MMRRSIWIVLMLAGIAFPIHPCAAQEDMRTLDSDAFARPLRPPALFAHDIHNENAGIDDCGACHHVYENGRRSEDETSEGVPCADCHAPAADAQNPIPLRRAFHLRCKGCHISRKAGPVMCAECHPRGLAVE